jgi:hypothetical protein
MSLNAEEFSEPVGRHKIIFETQVSEYHCYSKTILV